MSGEDKRDEEGAGAPKPTGVDDAEVVSAAAEAEAPADAPRDPEAAEAGAAPEAAPSEAEAPAEDTSAEALRDEAAETAAPAEDAPEADERAADERAAEPIVHETAETREPEPRAPDYHPEDDEHGEEGRRSLSSVALTYLAILLVGAGGALYIAPKAAPYLPASVAGYLTPVAAETDARLAALREEYDARLAELASEIAAVRETAAAPPDVDLGSVEGRLDGLAGAVETLAERVADAEDAAAVGPGVDPEIVTELRGRLESTEETVSGLRAELTALEEAAGSGDLGPTAAVLERTAAFGAAVEGLNARVDDLSERVAAIPGLATEEALSAVEARVSALETERTEYIAARDDAFEEAAAARRAALVTEALGRIERAMVLGDPFPEALDDIEDAVGEAAPDALARAAEGGVPTREQLKASFIPAARNAIAAAIRVRAAGDEGVFGGVLANLEASVTALPVEPVPGEDAPAVLSRARAALLEGDLDAALAGIEALPEEARAAMGDWYEGATLRNAADAALADWRAEIGRGL